MDKATLYASATRLVQGVSGLAAMLVVAGILSPEQQGTFFSMASLMGMQATAELGITVVLIQVASHEMASSAIHDQANPAEKESTLRIGSLLRQSILWTGIAAGLFFIVLAPLGVWFFSSSSEHSSLQWLLALMSTAIGLLFIPPLAIMEGCGAVSKAWRIRCYQQIGTGVGLPLALFAGLGNWSLGVAGVISIATLVVGMAPERGFLKNLWARHAPQRPLRWWSDVWPFQWRISLSYLCGIFIAQFAIPAVYRICGAVDAGRFGLSYAAMRAVSAIALSNVSSKAQLLGSLVASGDRTSLDRQFDSACVRSLVLGSLGLGSLVIGFHFMAIRWPHIAGRMLALAPLSILACGMVFNHATQCIAVYLRAHREEPLLIPSILGAVMLGIGYPIVAKVWGVLGVTYWFSITTCILGFATALILLGLKRHSFRKERN